ncbi:hypothetical protein AVEN_147641-1 [Araneus ventricosus]|uniref:Retrovirus-related Pol polyprotein from transposon TNT 1-94-like beta-barrel domain-containing protein n=1 Tax=Araneus ventricosus TaxID=182803 RepID=A0A4Y2HEK9_ARAVE|nr:hypothetical protein AVEN_147641-1 [Araneus ventricosus]
MRFDEHLFTEINPIDDTYVKLAADKTVKAIAKGTVSFDVLVGNQTKGITLQNVLYISDLKNNLISFSKVTANNFTVCTAVIRTMKVGLRSTCVAFNDSVHYTQGRPDQKWGLL